MERGPAAALFYREDLDAEQESMRGHMPVDEGTLLLQMCHGLDGLFVVYHAGVLIIECRTCLREMMRVAVASRAPAPPVGD